MISPWLSCPFQKAGEAGEVPSEQKQTEPSEPTAPGAESDAAAQAHSETAAAAVAPLKPIELDSDFSGEDEYEDDAGEEGELRTCFECSVTCIWSLEVDLCPVRGVLAPWLSSLPLSKKTFHSVLQGCGLGSSSAQRSTCRGSCPTHEKRTNLARAPRSTGVSGECFLQSCSTGCRVRMFVLIRRPCTC